MPLKVIGAGFGRTGTWSLCIALDQLGVPCYHMSELFEKAPHPPFSPYSKENESHLDFWHKVANGKAGTEYDWEKVLSKYAATVDYPACCVWRELLSAYPDAKVILTVHPRGADAWYESIVDTIYWLTETMWEFKVLQFATPYFKKVGEMFRKLIFERSLKGTISDRTKAIECYQQHIAEVKASVPATRLLVYSVDQGWRPLCTFLGVPEPSGEFPHANDRAAFKQTVRKVTRGVYAILAVCALAFAGVVYLIARVFWSA
jgi:hypothetical protein